MRMLLHYLSRPISPKILGRYENLDLRCFLRVLNPFSVAKSSFVKNGAIKINRYSKLCAIF